MFIVRWFVWPTFTVNAGAMAISLYAHDLWVLGIGCIGAGFSIYAWLYYLEDREETMGKPQGYRDLAARLRYEIVVERAMPPGSKVDSIAELADRFSTTRVTISRALHQLATEGLLEVVHGRGTYVLGIDGAPGFRDDRPRDHIERRLIVAGSGTELPSTQDLVREFDTTYATVRRVQLNLARQGVITRTRDGRYVRT